MLVGGEEAEVAHQPPRALWEGINGPNNLLPKLTPKEARFPCHLVNGTATLEKIRVTDQCSIKKILAGPLDQLVPDVGHLGRPFCICVHI